MWLPTDRYEVSFQERSRPVLPHAHSLCTHKGVPIKHNLVIYISGAILFVSVAQLDLECGPPKAEVTGSSPVRDTNISERCRFRGPTVVSPAENLGLFDCMVICCVGVWYSPYTLPCYITRSRVVRCKSHPDWTQS